ncbi:manganese catalase family protein, partial [bacterium]
MFYHDKRLQYSAEPSRPDALYAKKLQEALGGQFGEISVMMQYLFQGWNCRGPAKYKDMLLCTATEEIGHVEMLANMIARLLDNAPAEAQEAAANQSVAVEAVMGGTRVDDAIMNAAMNPQHFIANGLGAAPNDSVGFPWTARYIVSSGNIMADMRANVNAESQGRLQVARLYEMTEDPGIRDMFSFMLARDTMHQNQWLAAIEELKADGLDDVPTPMTIPLEAERRENAYQFFACSDGTDAKQGRWASGPTPDGKGEFSFVQPVEPMG